MQTLALFCSAGKSTFMLSYYPDRNSIIEMGNKGAVDGRGAQPSILEGFVIFLHNDSPYQYLASVHTFNRAIHL